MYTFCRSPATIEVILNGSYLCGGLRVWGHWGHSHGGWRHHPMWWHRWRVAIGAVAIVSIVAVLIVAPLWVVVLVGLLIILLLVVVVVMILVVIVVGFVAGGKKHKGWVNLFSRISSMLYLFLVSALKSVCYNQKWNRHLSEVHYDKTNQGPRIINKVQLAVYQNTAGLQSNNETSEHGST